MEELGKVMASFLGFVAGVLIMHLVFHLIGVKDVIDIALEVLSQHP